MSHNTHPGSYTAHPGEGAFAHALQDWADSVQKFVGSAPTLDAKMHCANEVVDSFFHVAVQMLVTQREFAKSFLAVTTGAAKDVHHMAKDDMNHMAKDVAPKKSSTSS